MYAEKFIEEFNRMCDSNICNTCPVSGFKCYDLNPYNIVDILDGVSKWSKEHPNKTRQSEFLKMFPNAHMNAVAKGVVSIMPCHLRPDLAEDCYNDCEECAKMFWLTEIE